MAFTLSPYPTRRFVIDGLKFEVRSCAKTDGLNSSLRMIGVEQAKDNTPNFGPEAVRNHSLECYLPDGRHLSVELGYIGMWRTGIIVRLDGEMVYESHPGRTPAYPEQHKQAIARSTGFSNMLKTEQEKANPGGVDPFSAGVFAKGNRLPFAIDVITGLLFFVIAKATDLYTAAIVGVIIGFGLVLYQRITKVDVTGGMALFGIFMLVVSAGLAFWSADEEWIKMRGTITGLIASSFFLIDGLMGGKYIGRGLARYMPYTDIRIGRFAIAMGIIGFIMAGLNYAVAKMASTDTWLFYKTFLDTIIVIGLVFIAIRFARNPTAAD